MQQRIFSPLSIHNLTMVPSPYMKERLTGIWERGEDGQLAHRDYPVQMSLEDEFTPGLFHSGGAGLFGSIREFGSTLLPVLKTYGSV